MNYKVVCSNPKCLHEWIPRKQTRACPCCKNILPIETQEEIAIILEPEQYCNRCGHTWRPRPGHEVNGCPRCNSKKWHKKRTNIIAQYRARDGINQIVTTINGLSTRIMAAYSIIE